MAESNEPNRSGLRGWKAFLVVVGSGVLASCLAFGLLVGGLNLVFGGVEPSKEGPAASQSRQPRKTTAPGVLNLCELVEGQSLASAAPHNRVGEPDGYSDTAEDSPGKDPRTVSDDCTWEVPSSSGGNWIFELSYVAFMESGESRDKLAETEFSKRIEDENSSFKNISAEGVDGRFQGESNYIYGEWESGEESYSLGRKVKTGIYQIRFEDSGSAENGKKVTEQEFRTQVHLVAPYLDTAFEHQIPD